MSAMPDSRLNYLLAFAAALLLAAACAAQPAHAANVPPPTGGRWKAGVNYKVISPAQPTNTPAGKVRVIEFFYLACPFCHALEPHMAAWRKTKPAYVRFEQVPVMWGSLQVADARLFYTLEALGRDDLVETAFNTMHQMEQQTGSEKVMIGSTPAQTFALQEAFAKQHGVSAAAFASAYNSFDVHVELGRARQLGQIYQITGTPTIIVGGRYETGPSFFHFRQGRAPRASGDSRTIELINFLAKWVHDHAHAG